MSDMGNNWNIGINTVGIEQVYQQIKLELIDNAKEALDNTTAVENTLARHWQGPDEEAFIANLKAFKDKIKEALDMYDQDIQKQFTAVKDDWVEFQSSNVTGGGQ